MDDATRGVGRQKRTSGTAQTEPPRASETLMSDEDEARAQAIRGEIAETRNEISETIDAIQERLQPGNLVAQAGETVRHAASEKVRQMANRAGDAADQVLGSSFMETVRANPVPAALIGIGAAWMLFNRRSRSRDYRYGEAYRGYGTSGRRGLSGETFDPDYAGSYGPVGTGGTTGSEDFEDVTSRAKEYTSDVTARAQKFTGEVRETARRTSQRAQVKFDDVLRNNPLALGAAAALVGAVVGMSMPPTETENQLMGEARDSVVDRARNLASDAAEQVSQAAGSAQSIASRAADQIKTSASGAHDTIGPRTDQPTPSNG
jgi:ElaB/YqjD/DUF883 family membrane-anchored ribosome-binding protein